MALNHARAITMIPVTDLDRAVPFYRDILDLQLVMETPYALIFSISYQSQISVYKRPPVDRGHTVVMFEVEDIERAVAELKTRGAVFEEYDQGPLKTIDGIATFDGSRGAWLKDPEGNVLGLREGPDPRGSIRDLLTV